MYKILPIIKQTSTGANLNEYLVVRVCVYDSFPLAFPACFSFPLKVIWPQQIFCCMRAF